MERRDEPDVIIKNGFSNSANQDMTASLAVLTMMSMLIPAAFMMD